ncbi:hypothetical protein CFC21_074156 [Triticum aestivum]|uniref:Uncharacterized protein n=3 Tax=Triticum aestivum TaxID=4565 RepID=A0A9R1HMP8_WHEAT|nr:hypothetical protein CFC21_074156 [Triticum aestivum]
MGLSLNIDISATSFFKPVTVVQFVLEFLNLRDASRPLTDRDRVKIKKALRGVRVETNHQEDQIRRYKITGIIPVPMSQLIFPVDERGTRMSVVQYFMQRYNYNLQYTSWPCLQSGSDARPVYLPMEACKIVEGQRYSKKLNDKQVTNILRATRQRPQQREQSIREMVLHNKYAQEFGINVCSDLVSVPARVLPPPMLRYHDSGKEKTCAPSVGQWNMINKKMINGGIIDNWACVSFSRMPPEEVHRFCCDLIQMCNMTGMSVNPRPLVDNRSANPNHIENALRDVYRRTTEMLGKQGHEKQLQLLIVILPEVSGSYGKIKKVCETDLGIVSQCCLPRHAARPNKQYLENVALKINVKVGGRNTVLERAFVRNGIPFVSEVPTIIFGADVTHPPPGEDSASSIAAVVASMDWPEITKYRGLVSAQPHRQEIIEDLFSVTKDPKRGNVNGGMIRELLIAFRRKTGRRPERILFYRDGVSEGQFSHVPRHEMDAIRKACASLEEGYMPPVTFVVVQKRDHTRLFPDVHGRRDMTDKSGNILPGSVFELMTCHPTDFGFYLCNNTNIQGTSCNYHVLYDENNFTADALQSLTKKLCNTYARCVPGLSTVAPAFYAHVKARVCTRHYIEGDGSTGELNIKLLGGGDNPDTGRPRKRHRKEESGSSSQSADHPTLGGNRISNISNAGRVPFVDYVKAHRGSFIVKVRVQDCTSTVVGRKEYRYDFDDIGRVLGSSFLIAYFDTHKENLTWGGELMFEDIEVSYGRIVVNRKPRVATSQDDFDKDIHVLVLMLRATFLPKGKNLPYFEGFLTFIEKSKFRNHPELLPYKRRPLVFMSPLERAAALDNLLKIYFRLNVTEQENFRSTLTNFDCPKWPDAKSYCIFEPLVTYQVNKHDVDTYLDEEFYCLLILRNHNEHGKVLPWELLDYASVACFGDFVQDSFLGLMLKGYEVHKALA